MRFSLLPYKLDDYFVHFLASVLMSTLGVAPTPGPVAVRTSLQWGGAQIYLSETISSSFGYSTAIPVDVR